MRFEILKWQSEGLRCPDFIFDLTKGVNAKASFLQMPNGTGKTTTLELLKSCLYDRQFTTSDIESYKPKIVTEIKDKAFFQTKFTIDGKIFYITINFDFAKKTHSYSSSLSDVGGHKQGFRLPDELESIVDKGLLDLLFVDLEIDVKPMFRSHNTNAQEAIRKLCKIKSLEKIINDFETYKISQRKKSVKNGNIITKINTEENRESKINNKIEAIEKKAAEYKKFLTTTDEEYNSKKKEIDEIIESDTLTFKKIKDLEKRRDEAKSNYEETLKNNLEAIKDIGSFDGTLKNEIIEFVTALDHMGLPEEEVRAFFKKILERKLCICGEELDDNKKQLIKKGMDKFISEKESLIISRIKDSVTKNTEKNKNDLDKCSKDINIHKFDLDALNEKIKTTTDNKLKDKIEMKQNNDALGKKRSEKQYFLDHTIKQDWAAKHNEENTESLVSLIQQRKNVEKILAELSGTKDIEDRVSFLNRLLETAKTNAELEISQQITQECNKKIKKMFTKNPIFINSIKNNIILEGQLGASTGQEARIGIIFLLSLLDRSKINFPLIIDTPVKGMDGAAKRRTAQFISELHSQFLCFVIDEDKSKFTDKFNEITNGKSNFITSFRRSEEFDKMITDNNVQQDQIYKSYNGQVVYDYPFFDKFTEEEDKE